MSKDRKVNLAARFLPASKADDDTLPMIDIAGAQVYAYVENGKLVVSVDLDTVSSSSYWPEGQASTPMEITVQGHLVYAGDEREQEAGSPRPYDVMELDEGQWSAVMDDGRLGPYPSAAEAELGALADIASDSNGAVFLCDSCYEAGTGDQAQCQDECSLDLDHVGECGHRYRTSVVKTACDRCGQEDRLTRIDVENLDFTREPFDPYMGDKHRYYYEN